jgi:hypothetical protein
MEKHTLHIYKFIKDDNKTYEIIAFTKQQAIEIANKAVEKQVFNITSLKYQRTATRSDNNKARLDFYITSFGGAEAVVNKQLKIIDSWKK